MKNTKRIFKFSMLGALLALGLVACNNGGGSKVPPNTVITNPCPPGQAQAPAGCIISPIAPIQQSAHRYTSSSGPNSQSTLKMNSNYRKLLSGAMGVCDRCENTGGLASCQSWMSGFNDLTLFFNPQYPTQAELVIRSTPQYNGYTYYSWNFPSLSDFFLSLVTFGMAPIASCNPGGYYPEMDLTLNFETSNGNSGFVVYGNAAPYISTWNRRALRLYVDNGKPGDASFNYRLTIIDENNSSFDIATGKFVAY